MTAYPVLRESLAPALRRLPDSAIETLVEAHGLEAEDLESFAEFWGQIGRGIQAALPTVGAAINQYGAPVAQGALAGAGTGAAFGPWGALIGALGGGVLGGVQSSQQGGQRPPAAPTPTPAAAMPTPAMPPLAGGPTMGAPSGGLGGSPAAGQLLALLARPEVMQALMALIMGRAGASSVNVGGTQIAPGAVANLVGQLGQQAASEAIVNGLGGMSTYWGGEREDETAPESRAAETFEVFARSAPEVTPTSWRESEPVETGYSFRDPESDYGFRPTLQETVWG